jgi:ubiquinone/menaquinone biosynthesis C-methylase UbiE
MVDKDAVRSGYDDLAEIYAGNRAPDEDELAILDRFLDSLSPSARILDAGCGQGEPVLRSLATDRAAVGLDLSRRQLQLAREAVPTTPILQGDMTRLPVDARTFDAVVAFHSLIHVPLVQHQQVVDECARVLRPGGRILLTEGTAEWCGTNPDWLDSGIEMQWHVAGQEATREQLREAGFRITSESTAKDELAEEESSWLFFEAELTE